MGITYCLHSKVQFHEILINNFISMTLGSSRTGLFGRLLSGIRLFVMRQLLGGQGPLLFVFPTDILPRPSCW